jgi:hypothetical protein
MGGGLGLQQPAMSADSILRIGGQGRAEHHFPQVRDGTVVRLPGLVQVGLAAPSEIEREGHFAFAAAMKRFPQSSSGTSS